MTFLIAACTSLVPDALEMAAARGFAYSEPVVSFAECR
jgi:hypothetical protein